MPPLRLSRQGTVITMVRDKNEGEEDAADASFIGGNGGARLRMQGSNHIVAKEREIGSVSSDRHGWDD